MGSNRFDQIVRNTGASRDILATRLRKLVEAGVLDKQQYESHPPRYEYVLTEAGRALRPILHGLMEWGDRYVTPGRAPAELEHACGAALQVETGLRTLRATRRLRRHPGATTRRSPMTPHQHPTWS